MPSHGGRAGFITADVETEAMTPDSEDFPHPTSGELSLQNLGLSRRQVLGVPQLSGSPLFSFQDQPIAVASEGDTDMGISCW